MSCQVTWILTMIKQISGPLFGFPEHFFVLLHKRKYSPQVICHHPCTALIISHGWRLKICKISFCPFDQSEKRKKCVRWGEAGGTIGSYHKPKLMWGSNLVTSSKILTSHKVMILKMDQAFFCRMTTNRRD